MNTNIKRESMISRRATVIVSALRLNLHWNPSESLRILYRRFLAYHTTYTMEDYEGMKFIYVLGFWIPQKF